MTTNSCGIVQGFTFTCLGCGNVFTDHAAAKACAAQGLPQTDFRPGDVVTDIGHTGGWYEGDSSQNPWVRARPNDGVFRGGAAMKDVKTLYERFWVVTAIEVHRHDVRLHAVTLGGYQEKRRLIHCWTSRRGHFWPDRVADPPKELVDWWKENATEWIGKLSEHLS